MHGIIGQSAKYTNSQLPFWGLRPARSRPVRKKRNLLETCHQFSFNFEADDADVVFWFYSDPPIIVEPLADLSSFC